MARYREGDEVTYAGNAEVFKIVDVKEENHATYVLEDIRGHRHDCHQAHILRLHRRWTTKV